MVYNGEISAEQKALALYLKTETQASYREIAKKCKISKSSAQRKCNTGLTSKKKSQPAKMGRPKKISQRSTHMKISM